MHEEPASAALVPHKKLSEESARRHLRQQSSSGMSLPRYCKEHGLPYGRLVCLRRKLHGPTRPRRQSGTLFVPVDVKPESTAQVPLPAAPAAPTAPIAVRLRGGREILVGSGFEPAALHRLIAALEADAC